MKKILALLTAVLLVITAAGCGNQNAPQANSEPTVPAQTENVQETKQASPVSVFVCTDRHDKMDGTGNNLCGVLKAVASDSTVVQPSVFVIGGDNVGSGPDNGDNGHPDFSVEDVIGEVHSVFPDGQVLMTFGSHDAAAKEGVDAFLNGPAPQNGFYVYGITFSQMRYADRESAEEKNYAYLDAEAETGLGAGEGVKAFTDWANTLEDHLPIIVMSHMPLHANRGDNVGAGIWAEALNAAAQEHPVIVLFGHNHTSEERATEEKPSCDPSFYLVPAGGSMPIQQADTKTEDCKPSKIRFTYMNAGYIKLGFGSVITFEDLSGDGMYDHATIARYSQEGLSPDFGTTGLIGPYSFDLTAKDIDFASLTAAEETAFEIEEDPNLPDALAEELDAAKKAEESGDYAAASSKYMKIGSAYRFGKETEKDDNRAAYYLNLAGRYGAGDCYFTVGELYEAGALSADGTPDYERARNYYILAATADKPFMKGARNAGRMYEEGGTVEQNYGAAAYFYEIAVSLNDVSSCYYLGNLYEQGCITENGQPDLEKAYEYYTLCYEKNNYKATGACSAIGRLAYFYENGIVVEADASKASELYALAASYGDADAQAACERLGIPYESQSKH